MKKRLVAVLIVLLVAVFAFSGCSFGFSFIRDSISNVQDGKGDQNPDKDPDTDPDPDVNVDPEYEKLIVADPLQRANTKFWFGSASEKEREPYRFLPSSSYPLMSTVLETDDQLYQALSGDVRVKPKFKNATCDASVLYKIMLSVLDNIISNDMGEFDKVLAIHDWIVYNTAYDHEMADSYLDGTYQPNMATDNEFNLLGIFKDKSAVCRGLSRAFVALCRIEGIDAVSIPGDIDDDITNGGHEWSKVFIHTPENRDCSATHDENCPAAHATCSQVVCEDDTHRAWYLVDVTNGNIAISGEGNKVQYEVLNHAFFLIGDSNAIINHKGTTKEDMRVYKADDGYKNPSAPNDYTLSNTTKEYGFYEFVKIGEMDFSPANAGDITAIFAYAAENKFDTMEFFWIGSVEIGSILSNAMLAASKDFDFYNSGIIGLDYDGGRSIVTTGYKSA